MEVGQCLLYVGVPCFPLVDLPLEEFESQGTRIVRVRKGVGLAWTDLIYSQGGGLAGRMTSEVGGELNEDELSSEYAVLSKQSNEQGVGSGQREHVASRNTEKRVGDSEVEVARAPKRGREDAEPADAVEGGTGRVGKL